jgi:hypothetical protein
MKIIFAGYIIEGKGFFPIQKERWTLPLHPDQVPEFPVQALEDVYLPRKQHCWQVKVWPW